MPQSFQFRVVGHVQGVFFRVFTQKSAQSIGVVGYVQNDVTGDVSGVAQGTQAALDEFKEAIAQGPRHAKVTEVDITNEEEIDQYEFSSFEIRRHRS